MFFWGLRAGKSEENRRTHSDLEFTRTILVFCSNRNPQGNQQYEPMCSLRCQFTASHKYHPAVKKFFLFETVARVLEARLNAVTATRHTYKVLEILAFFFLR